MKRIPYALITLGLVLTASHTYAAENWTTRLPGVTEGLASGALPPEGVYFINDTLYTPTDGYDRNGKKNGVKLDAFVDVPILLWVPGVKFLGADYAVGFAQPFDYVSTYLNSRGIGGTNLGSGAGLYDTLLMPGQLSWALPYDFHVLAGLGVWLPTGTYSNNMAVKNSNKYWAIEPQLGISWLHGGWNVSVNMTYDVNFDHNHDGTKYTSGDQFIAEYSITDTIGKWTFGIGGYALTQVADDRRNGVSLRDTAAQKYAIGPIVGYNFGPVILQGFYNYNIHTANYVGGDEFWTRLIIPF